MRVAVEKLPGVDAVRVSLNEGYADITFAESNAVTVTQVRDAIRRNGFTPREARVRIRGRIAPGEGGLALDAPGAGRFALTGDSAILDRLRGGGPAPTTLEGDIAETGIPAIRVRRVEAGPPLR